MKRTVCLCAMAILVMVYSKPNVYGQDSENALDIKAFGLGMHVEQFKLADITMNIPTAPANKIVITISPSKNFRLEPEIGFNVINDKNNDLKDRSTFIGIGAYGMFQKGKTNFYGGIKFESGNFSSEYKDWEDNKETEKMTRIAIGPAIGMEFFFGKHFSFGGEMALKFMRLKSKDSQYDEEEMKENYISTDSGLVLRFYL